MDGNVPGGDFPGGIFQGGVWWVGIFRVGIFLGGIFLEPNTWLGNTIIILVIQQICWKWGHVDLTVHNTVMFIKFSKQIANSYLMATKAKPKPCQTSKMELLARSRYWAQRRTQNLAKHLRWSFCKNSQKLKAIHNLCKNILDVWQGSEHASELFH